MKTIIEIQPGNGFSNFKFGATMLEAEKIFGKTTEVAILDDIEDSQSIVWHYWDLGFSLFFDVNNKQLFSCVEIDNHSADLWNHKIFDLKEKEIIELFTEKGFKNYETEHHDWGEKRISFDDLNIDFYFEKNKLVSVNYGKININSQILILPN